MAESLDIAPYIWLHGTLHVYLEAVIYSCHSPDVKYHCTRRLPKEQYWGVQTVSTNWKRGLSHSASSTEILKEKDSSRYRSRSDSCSSIGGNLSWHWFFQPAHSDPYVEPEDRRIHGLDRIRL